MGIKKMIMKKKHYMKIKCNPDDDLPLNKLLKFNLMTIIIRRVFSEVVNFIYNFFQMTFCMNQYNNAIVRKN